jgi:ribonuclease P/MRP protein subunit POP8
MAELQIETDSIEGDKMDIDVGVDANCENLKTSKGSKPPPSRGHDITTKTIKTPPFSYACLELITSSPIPVLSPNPSSVSSSNVSTPDPIPFPSTINTNTTPSLDVLTTRTYLTSAVAQFLGLTGSAISIDILKIQGLKVWIRTPREDLAPVLAAVGGWVGKGSIGAQEKVGWRVRGSGNWLSSLVAQGEEGSIWKDV